MILTKYFTTYIIFTLYVLIFVILLVLISLCYNLLHLQYSLSPAFVRSKMSLSLLSFSLTSTPRYLKFSTSLNIWSAIWIWLFELLDVEKKSNSWTLKCEDFTENSEIWINMEHIKWKVINVCVNRWPSSLLYEIIVNKSQ